MSVLPVDVPGYKLSLRFDVGNESRECSTETEELLLISSDYLKLLSQDVPREGILQLMPKGGINPNTQVVEWHCDFMVTDRHLGAMLDGVKRLQSDTKGMLIALELYQVEATIDAMKPSS